MKMTFDAFSIIFLSLAYGLAHYSPSAKTSPPPVFVNNFYWDMVLPILLCAVYASLMLQWPSWTVETETM